MKSARWGLCKVGFVSMSTILGVSYLRKPGTDDSFDLSVSLQSQDLCLYHLPACFVKVEVRLTVLDTLGKDYLRAPCWPLHSWVLTADVYVLGSLCRHVPQ